MFFLFFSEANEIKKKKSLIILRISTIYSGNRWLRNSYLNIIIIDLIIILRFRIFVSIMCFKKKFE